MPRSAAVRPMTEAATSEADWQRTVTDALALFGWEFWHVYDSRGTRAGLSDLIAVQPVAGRLLFAECKTATGRVRPGQAAFLDLVRRVTHPPEARLWRPGDFEDVLHTLDWRNL